MEKLILLHGALGSKSQFESLISAFSHKFDVYFLEFSGHGIQPYKKEFSVGQFSKELIQFIEKNNIQACHVFGFSMGGYVALYSALQKPEYFKSIQTLATKFEWSQEIAKKETLMLDADVIKEKVPAFAEDLSKRHNDWQKLLESTKILMRNLGEKPLLTKENLNLIKIPVTVMRGENDAMVGESESRWAVDKLSNANYFKIDGAKHPIEKYNMAVLQKLIEANILSSIK